MVRLQTSTRRITRSAKQPNEPDEVESITISGLCVIGDPNVFVDYDTQKPPGRQHPWTFVVTKPEERYVDFKAHPDQIALVLSDFKPWSNYSAIQTFYSLLAWLNGPDSVLESNDCGLRPPRKDAGAPNLIRNAFDADPIVMHSRLTVIFRDLTRNVSVSAVNRLKTSIHNCLRDNAENIPAVVTVGEWAHFFTTINKEGQAVTLLSWSWGKDEAMAMVHLNTTFRAIHVCLRSISDSMKTRP
jgi:hypothetical protein